MSADRLCLLPNLAAIFPALSSYSYKQFAYHGDYKLCRKLVYAIRHLKWEDYAFPCGISLQAKHEETI